MAEIELLNQIRQKVSQRKKTVVLPESHDERVLRAAEILTKEKVASVITLGDEDKIRSDAKSIGVDLQGIRIIDQNKSDKLSDFTNIFYNLRKHKGITIEQAKETVRRDIFFAGMMVREGLAHSSVGGSIATTADITRAGIFCVGLGQGMSILSSFFLMAYPDSVYSFADCAVNPNPDSNQLADIAIATADNHKKLTGEEPFIAMLSFSTKGSAEHELIDKVRQATKLVQEKRPDLNVDGELQFDAAIVESIGKKKAPSSKVAGRANVLVFPDLNAGNIGYKIAQRLGGAEAVGPINQGLQKPFYDLSRGCSVDDIVNTAAISCLAAE